MWLSSEPLIILKTYMWNVSALIWPWSARHPPWLRRTQIWIWHLPVQDIFDGQWKMVPSVSWGFLLLWADFHFVCSIFFHISAFLKQSFLHQIQTSFHQAVSTHSTCCMMLLPPILIRIAVWSVCEYDLVTWTCYCILTFWLLDPSRKSTSWVLMCMLQTA